MTKEQLDEMLAGMDERERELTLAMDDAQDALMAYKLEKQYGVTVECNPGGDRTLIKIDGVVMNHEQFAQWLFGKQLEAMGRDLQDIEDLPEEVDINYDELTEYSDNSHGPGPIAVKKYLRSTYEHCLAKGTNPTMDFDDDENIVHVSDIEWGRKLSRSELEAL